MFLKIIIERGMRMGKIRVLMIDDNVNLVEMIKEYFHDNKKIEVVESCNDGEEWLDLILNKYDN